jgi:hypothetical protein
MYCIRYVRRAARVLTHNGQRSAIHDSPSSK